MTETRVVTPAALLAVWPCHAPTPLVDLPRLATRCGVARVLHKDEGLRPLGSFKALGGTYAGLRALARAIGLPDIATPVAAGRPSESLASLMCASDGNHGQAVAAAADLAGAPARVYLHGGVPPARARRIAARGAEIVRIGGTYGDAVVKAARDATRRWVRVCSSLTLARTRTTPSSPTSWPATA